MASKGKDYQPIRKRIHIKLINMVFITLRCHINLLEPLIVPYENSKTENKEAVQTRFKRVQKYDNFFEYTSGYEVDRQHRGT